MPAGPRGRDNKKNQQRKVWGVQRVLVPTIQGGAIRGGTRAKQPSWGSHRRGDVIGTHHPRWKTGGARRWRIGEGGLGTRHQRPAYKKKQGHSFAIRTPLDQVFLGWHGEWGTKVSSQPFAAFVPARHPRGPSRTDTRRGPQAARAPPGPSPIPPRRPALGTEPLLPSFLLRTISHPEKLGSDAIPRTQKNPTENTTTKKKGPALEDETGVSARLQHTACMNTQRRECGEEARCLHGACVCVVVGSESFWLPPCCFPVYASSARPRGPSWCGSSCLRTPLG